MDTNRNKGQRKVLYKPSVLSRFNAMYAPVRHHYAELMHTAIGPPAPLLWAPARVTHSLWLAPAAKQRLQQICTRAASVSGEKCFCIPDTNGFLGLPLRETQKADPKDVKGFWMKHAPPLEIPPALLSTEQGHSLLEEWDNGTCLWVYHTDKQVPPCRITVSPSLRVLLRSAGLVQVHLAWRRASAQHQPYRDTQGCP